MDRRGQVRVLRRCRADGIPAQEVPHSFLILQIAASDFFGRRSDFPSMRRPGRQASATQSNIAPTPPPSTCGKHANLLARRLQSRRCRATRSAVTQQHGPRTRTMLYVQLLACTSRLPPSRLPG